MMKRRSDTSGHRFVTSMAETGGDFKTMFYVYALTITKKE